MLTSRLDNFCYLNTAALFLLMLTRTHLSSDVLFDVGHQALGRWVKATFKLGSFWVASGSREACTLG